MADIDSSLPIRSIQDVDERVLVKIQDSADPTGTNKQTQVSDNSLWVKPRGQQVGGGTNTLLLSQIGAIVLDGLYDASNNTDPSNVGLIAAARAATPGDADQTQRLTSGTPTASGLTDANIHALDTNGFLHGYNGSTWDRILSTSGSMNVNVTNPISVNIDGVYNAGTNATPDNIGAIFHARATTPDATNQTLRSTGATASSDNVSPGTVWGIDVNSFGMAFDGTNWDRLRTAGAGTGALAVGINDATGTAFSFSNPLPVTFTDNPGTDVVDGKLAVAVAGFADDVHTYTVTAGKTLYLTQVNSSGSGRAKMVVARETGVATGVYTTIDVQFNSTATPNMMLTLKNPIQVAAGVRVQVTMTNRETAAQDIFSSIIGYEI